MSGPTSADTGRTYGMERTCRAFGVSRSSTRSSRKRVLRLMREANFHSPHRRPQGAERLHVGTITATKLNETWGTDGARTFTLDGGWIWIFLAVGHWNAECLGYQATKRDSRSAALEPVAMALTQGCGSARADVARGFALRSGHGSQYLADHCLNQIRYGGIALPLASRETTLDERGRGEVRA